MKTLSNALDEYLALRRSMGFTLRDHERVLRKFIVFLHEQGTEYITTPLALDWAQQPQHTTQIHKAQRLSKVRGFAQYLSAIDPRTEVPEQGLLPAKPQRAQPYIYTENPEQRLPLLSAYPGHAKVSDTYWYLSAVPELLGAISTRLDNYLGDLS